MRQSSAKKVEHSKTHFFAIFAKNGGGAYSLSSLSLLNNLIYTLKSTECYENTVVFTECEYYSTYENVREYCSVHRMV